MASVAIMICVIFSPSDSMTAESRESQELVESTRHRYITRIDNKVVA